MGCGQTRCQGGAIQVQGQLASLSSHCVMSEAVFLGLQFLLLQNKRKKEIVSKQPHCLSCKKAVLYAFICFLTTGLDGFWPENSWLWACILNSEAAPYTCSWAAPTGCRAELAPKSTEGLDPARGLRGARVRDVLFKWEKNICWKCYKITWQLVNTFKWCPYWGSSFQTPGWCSHWGLWICFWKWEPGFHKNSVGGHHRWEWEWARWRQRPEPYSGMYRESVLVRIWENLDDTNLAGGTWGNWMPEGAQQKREQTATQQVLQRRNNLVRIA